MLGAILGAVLGILWFIIKLILWLILGIVCLLLMILLTVIFTPVRYELEGSKYEDIRAKVRVSYLLRLIRASYVYTPEGTGLHVKVLFFTVMKEETISAEEEPPEPEPKVPELDTLEPEEPSFEEAEEIPEEAKEGLKETEEGPEEAEEVPEDEVEVQQRDNKQSKPEIKEVDQPAKKVEPTVTGTEDRTQRSKKAKAPRTSAKKTKKKTETDEETTFEKVKRFYRFLREDRNKGVLRMILKRLFKAIGSVLPRRFEGKIHFGAGDPAMTGYLFGAASVFYPKYKDSLVLTPDFDDFIIEGEAKVAGKIAPAPFVWALIRIALDRRVWRLYKEARK